MARPVFVKRARNEYKTDDGQTIKVGDSYYWWKFNFSKTTHRSLTPPKPEQLTQSEFMQTVYGIGADIQAMTVDTLEDDLENIKSQIEDLQSETDDKLSNMPYGLQEGTVGQMLQGRVDSLEDWRSELDNIEIPDKPLEPNSSADEDEKEEYKKALAQYQESMDQALSSAKETGYSGE